MLPVVGQKGVKYGLQKPTAKGPAAAAAAPPSRPLGNVFGAESDSDEEDVGKQVARQAEKKRAAAKVRTQELGAVGLPGWGAVQSVRCPSGVGVGWCAAWPQRQRTGVARWG